MENETQELSVALPGEWALRKAFGPALEEVGEDIKRLYAWGRDRILAAGFNKIRNVDDGKKANLRVMRDVFWNGAFTDDEICAEYFGGILASSRSKDGKDDSSIHFLGVIKSMSSNQLRLHYLIYSALNRMLIESSTPVNVAQSSEIQKKKIFLSLMELQNAQINTDTDFNVIFRQGLLSEYKTDRHLTQERVLPYASASPTTYGVLLYAAAHNRLENWRSFSSRDFGVFANIRPPRYFAETLLHLVRQIDQGRQNSSGGKVSNES